VGVVQSCLNCGIHLDACCVDVTSAEHDGRSHPVELGPDDRRFNDPDDGTRTDSG
jgi:hypothetical protein